VTHLTKDKNDDLLADSILNRWKNYFSKLLNIQAVNIFSELYTAELLVPESSFNEV